MADLGYVFPPSLYPPPKSKLIIIQQNAQMRSIFARTYLDDSILPTGYIDWAPSRYNASNGNYSTVQAEYKNYGPGYNATARALSLFDVQYNDSEWAPYSSPAEVFQDPEGKFGDVSWVDFTV